MQVTIPDTGVGMDSTIASRVFEPFFTTKEKGKGTGLGLAVVYGCMKSHRGMVRLTTEPGKGTAVRLLLPVTTKTPEPAVTDARELPQTGEKTLLIVDDEEMIRNFAARILKSMGHKTLTAADGEDAVRQFADHHDVIDLVLLDMVMPKMNGEQVFARLREIDPEVKVLIWSGYSQNGSADLLLSEGACGFISKPFELDQLQQEVARCL
ncbi:MAG: response regulator [Phycisphaerae bacterium]